MFRKKDLHVHFVGIGGMGMCGIAEVLKNLGYRVTGSDITPSAITEHLEKIGCTVHYGHSANNLSDAHVVVVSSAIKGYNPEVEAARARQIPVIPRAEMLGELMRMKYGICVAGSHGKTTTTTMIAHVLMAAGLDPTAVIGGRVNALGLANARLGKSEYLVAEADESDGSFLKLPPTMAVVTNIDPEHMDHYGSFDEVKKAFVDFINRVPFYATAVLCLDHPVVQDLLPLVQKRFLTYGTASQATYRARNVRHRELSSTFIAWRKADELGEITIPMPGAYNVQNALAVLAVADELGVPFKTISAALANFDGIQRRFTLRGEVGGITIVDDFGHHPAEVRATLNGARAGFAGRRVVAAFQPHRYSRTRDQFHEFARSFYDADKVVICDVFPAGEAPIDGANSEALVAAIKANGHKDVSYVAKREDIAGVLAKQVRAGDIVITLGAGDIQLSCNELIAALEANGATVTHKNLAVRRAVVSVLSAADRDELAALLPGQVVFDEPMRRRTTLKIGGPADALCTPATIDAVVSVVRLAKSRGWPVTAIGGGTNLLVRDGGIRGLVLATRNLRTLARDGATVVRVEAGVSTGKLLSACTRWELGGVEFLGGVPGSVGGGMIMNAGTYLGEFKDVTREVTSVRLEDGALVRRDNSACGFGYRRSELPASEIVVEAVLQLQHRAAAEIQEDVRKLKQRRNEREPKQVSNSGSTFKNPEGDYAGRIIEAAGLKGARVGAAEVSPKHANWLVNTGGASAADLLALIDIVRKKVVADCGIELQLELKILGEE